MKIVLIACLLLAAAVVHAQPTPRFGEVFALDISSQRLPAALQALSNQTGLQIVYGSHDVTGVRSAAISGEMDYQQALRQMLVGTGLTYRVDEFRGRVVILRRDAAFSPRLRNDRRGLLTQPTQRLGPLGQR